jgi:hypothetical protein
VQLGRGNYVRFRQQIGRKSKYGNQKTGRADADHAPQQRDHFLILL